MMNDYLNGMHTNRVILCGLLFYLISLFWPVPDYNEMYVPSLSLVFAIFPVISIGLRALSHGDFVIGIARILFGVFGILVGNVMMLILLFKRGVIIPSKRYLAFFTISTIVILVFVIKMIMISFGNSKGFIDDAFEMAGVIFWFLSFAIVLVGLIKVSKSYKV